MDAASVSAQTSLIQTGLHLVSLLNLTEIFFSRDAVVQNGDAFDFIIVGAGAAGSIVANRLTECKDVNVLLIEAGGDTPFTSFYPGLSTTLQKSFADWNYTSENDGYTQQCKKMKVLEMARGKMLGGSSGLNYMAYTRGNPHDYDMWADISGDDSWRWENIISYFMKSEKLNDEELLASKYGAYHGNNGYLGVTKPKNDIKQKYFKALQEMGHNIVLDTNSIDYLGYSDLQLTIENNIRQSTSYSFLSPIKDRPNLKVMKNALVTKVLFDEFYNAAGVEVYKNGNVIVVKATKEVIVSGGAINTPQLLMLSGIGPRENLESVGVKVLVDNPWVGQNLQDHIPTLVIHKTKQAYYEKEPFNPYVLFPYLVGYVALNKSQTYPDYQVISIPVKNTEVDHILEFCSIVYLFNDEICNSIYELVKGDREILFTVISLLNQKSRGQILLKSSNPFDHPIIYTGFYSDNDDLERHVDSVLDFMGIINTTLFKSWDAELVDPRPEMCRDFEYGSRDYMRCFLRCFMASQYHYTCTCPMGYVVDSRLRVYGVNRLRIIDASIMPTIASGNTYAPTMMIGEKGADMVKEDFDLICQSERSNGF